MVGYYTNEVTFCKKDVCVTVKGEIANVIAATLLVAAITIGFAELSKALK